MKTAASNAWRARIRKCTEAYLWDNDPDFQPKQPCDNEYAVEVESGSSDAFLLRFYQLKDFNLIRLADSNRFLDCGGAKSLNDGQIVELTFDECFPVWLDCKVSVAKRVLAQMTDEAIDRLTRTQLASN